MAKPDSFKVLSLGALSFLAAGLAQWALGSPLQIAGWTVDGWILYAAAALLFVAAFRQSVIVSFAPGQRRDAPGSATQTALTQRQWLFVGNATVAMLCSAFLFGEPRTLATAWTLHLLSILLFIAAFIPFGKIAHPTLPSRAALSAQAVNVLPLVVVIALAAFARLWQLGEFPFGNWADEASNGLAAAQILKDASFRPVFIQDTLLPAHFNYLIAFSFSLFGITVTALRLITAAFGIAAVLFAYLLFRRWFGQGIGIVAACMLAVMRYHLTFSRFGMQGIATPAFELAALYFLDRALAEKKVSGFAWLGLAVGFGLAFYFAFRLFPVIVAVFLVCLLVGALVKYGARETNRRYLRGMWQQWLIAALGLVLALTPVLQFAARNPQDFMSRTGTTSIFEHRAEPDLAKAYWDNLTKHLAMFNVRGDNNGRHNLPGAPMLDPVMGVLFILGVAFALWRWRDPTNLLMLLLFVLALHGGILSLDFEAPQSLRSIGVIPALAYFITLPIAAVTQTIARAARRASADSSSPKSNWLRRNSGIAAWSVGVLILLGCVTYLNLDLFFNKYKNDPSAWAQSSTPQTIVASEMNRLASDHDFVVTALYADSPTVRFLAGDITNRQSWTVTDRLPLVRDATRGVVLFFDERLISAYREARRLYPNAQFQELHAPGGGDGIVLWQVTLSAEDLRAAQGVEARYYAGDTVKEIPDMEKVISNLEVDWTQIAPLPEPFTAQLRSTLVIQEYGEYRFTLRGDSSAALWIDENLVEDAPITLARGAHALRLQVGGGAKKVELWWQKPKAAAEEPVPAVNLFRSPVSNNGLLGTYYPSTNWSGAPAFAQIDPELNYYFHVTPLPRPYSIEWTGTLYAPTSGEYKFALNSIDTSRLQLDGQPVVENPSGQTTENAIHLERGWHDITVHFSDTTGATRIYLYWTPPGAKNQELVPTRNLLPPMGRAPDELSSATTKGHK